MIGAEQFDHIAKDEYVKTIIKGAESLRPETGVSMMVLSPVSGPLLAAPAHTMFTPVLALAGGMLIGLSASLLWLSIGRIAGISGILGAMVNKAERGWRAAFLFGLIAMPLVARGLGIAPRLQVQGSPGLLVLAGLLVGVGSALAGGCTSGHGICGLSRASPRSLAATATFMGVAVLVVGLTRAVL